MTQANRLDHTGLVDRSETLRFTFNGTAYDAHPGDTLASALIANDVKLVARSFKYHRPRGIFTAGPEEPSALFTLGRDGAQEPNARGTVTEVFHGLEARSQNHLGSLENDLMAVNDAFSAFLGAGFYYKTFMWPRRSGNGSMNPSSAVPLVWVRSVGRTTPVLTIRASCTVMCSSSVVVQPGYRPR